MFPEFHSTSATCSKSCTPDGRCSEPTPRPATRPRRSSSPPCWWPSPSERSRSSPPSFSLTVKQHQHRELTCAIGAAEAAHASAPAKASVGRALKR